MPWLQVKQANVRSHSQISSLSQASGASSAGSSKNQTRRPAQDTAVNWDMGVCVFEGTPLLVVEAETKKEVTILGVP